ncbi:MAG: OsmC family peroxiredoxin [Spirochaetaceae bacterium]|nr:MAG: OsmC family peroxiredoxin [Spirochaetaceae bacterium]
MAKVSFGVSARSHHPTRLEVSAREHRLVVDEPEKLGGTDAGPNPLEYMLAALAGCINVTGHLVAKELGFEIRELSMDIMGELNPARFMGRPTEDRSGFTLVKVEVRLEADIGEETRQNWIESVESRCPISDTMGAGTSIEVFLV